MKINDPSLWPSDLGVLRLELDGDAAPGSEAGALVADGVLVATLHHHDVGDQSFWELRIVAADGTRAGARVLFGTPSIEEEYPPRGVVAWATLAVLWHLKGGARPQG